MRALILCLFALGCGGSTEPRPRPADQEPGNSGSPGVWIEAPPPPPPCDGRSEAEVIEELCASGLLVSRVTFPSDCSRAVSYLAIGYDSLSFGFTLENGVSLYCGLPNCVRESECFLCPERRADYIKAWGDLPGCQ